MPSCRVRVLVWPGGGGRRQRLSLILVSSGVLRDYRVSAWLRAEVTKRGVRYGPAFKELLVQKLED